MPSSASYRRQWPVGDVEGSRVLLVLQGEEGPPAVGGGDLGFLDFILVI